MKYEETNNKSWRIDDAGTVELMCNFVMTITEEVRYIDGLQTRSLLTITGIMNKPDDPDGREKPLLLPPVEIDTDQFANFSWVVPNWGIKCIIRPGSGVKEDMRVMTQIRSNPEVRTVYKQTGWQDIDGKQMYLHGGGAIGARGNDPSVETRLPPELGPINLATAVSPQDGFNAVLDLTTLGGPQMMWCLIAGGLAPLYGPCDFGLQLTGRTGSFKSEVASIIQAFYGPTFNARNLPASWSSTGNAIEALAFFAKNAVMVLDDFVPQGTAWQQRQLQGQADKIIRAQGNQAGRARLSDTSNLQQTMYPRGVILSTGEDTPEGHSVRARMLILEMTPGNIKPPSLSAAQAARPLLVGNTAWLAQSLAKQPADLDARREALRAGYRDIGHTRTPTTLATLVAVAEDWLDRAVADGLASKQQAAKYKKEAKASIEAVGKMQGQYLEDADPVEVFYQQIRGILGTGGGHFRTRTGGIPTKAGDLGWTSEAASGELPTYKARGVCLGWVVIPEDLMYLDSTAGYKAVKKAAGAAMPLGDTTFLKRLKDSGALKATDTARQRNTVRVTLDGSVRQCIALSLSEVLDNGDMTDDAI